MRVMLDHEPEHSTNTLQVGDVVRLVDKSIWPRPAGDVPAGAMGVVADTRWNYGAKPRVEVILSFAGIERLRQVRQVLHPSALERIP